MIFDRRAQLMEFTETSPDFFDWTENKKIWVNAEPQNKTNLFSKVGIGVRTMLFTLRRTDIKLHNAIRMGGRDYFLTAVKSDPIIMQVTAAQVTLVSCAAVRYEDVGGVEQDLQPIKTIHFPGVLTEKYVGYQQGEPLAQTTTTFVLVTPKAVQLQVGDIVEISGESYILQVPHELDEYKNEYEIIREVDA